MNGYVFEPMDTEEIKRLILGIDYVVYQKLIEGVSKFSVYEKDFGQINAY